MSTRSGDLAPARGTLGDGVAGRDRLHEQRRVAERRSPRRGAPRPRWTSGQGRAVSGSRPRPRGPCGERARAACRGRHLPSDPRRPRPLGPRRVLAVSPFTRLRRLRRTRGDDRARFEVLLTRADRAVLKKAVVSAEGRHDRPQSSHAVASGAASNGCPEHKSCWGAQIHPGPPAGQGSGGAVP